MDRSDPQPPTAEADSPPLVPAAAEGAVAGGVDGGPGGPGGAPDGPGTSTARRRRRQGLEWVVLVAASLAVALLVRAFLVQAFYIPSESMLPTLERNDRVLVNKLSYRLHDVNRGDIVVFKAPREAATPEVKDLIKRVVGLPGETIEGRAGEIFIDGAPLDEPYLPPDVRSREFGPEKVPEDAYWVLGDNRQDSRDSTFFKAIDEDDIIGRAFVRIWPPGDVGLL